jgi:hypothetical protein
MARTSATKVVGQLIEPLGHNRETHGSRNRGHERRRLSRFVPIFSVVTILASLPTLSEALRIERIASLETGIGGLLPCGDGDHDGWLEVYGTGPVPCDSLVSYEHRGNNVYHRASTYAPMTMASVSDFGDGDNDGLADVTAGRQPAVVVFEARAADSLPTDSVWGVCPDPYNPVLLWPKYTDLDRDGRRELALTVSGCGIWLYENSGDDHYDFVALLVDSPPSPYSYYVDFAVADFDRDSLTELVTGGTNYVLRVFEATGLDNVYVMSARCTSETFCNYSIAAAHDMDSNGWPEFIALGIDSATGYGKLMVYEATSHSHYHRVWEQLLVDVGGGDRSISVGDVDGDCVEEFAIATGWGVVLYKCNGLHSYERVWTHDTCNDYVKVFDINRDGRAEIMFDEGLHFSIYEDVEGAIGSFLPSQVITVQTAATIVRGSMHFQGLPSCTDIEILSLDGRLVCRARVGSLGNWTWDLRDSEGRLISAGTYLAVLRSAQGVSVEKLCVVE